MIKKIGITIFLVMFSMGISTPAFAADVLTRVSVSDAGAESNGNSFNSDGISEDGRYVAFSSTADNLVASDVNGDSDVFVYDTENSTIELISVDSNGDQDTTGISSFASISDDGRYVVFRSSADDLVSPATDGNFHIFLRDRTLGTTTLIDVDASGAVTSNDSSYTPVISGDGSTIAFLSDGTNLLASASTGVHDVFVRDRDDASTLKHATIDTLGGDPNDNSFSPALSEDGRYVVFSSVATDLDTVCGPNIAPYVYATYRRDLTLDVTECISVDETGTVTNNIDTSANNFPSISADGRYVTFIDMGTNLDTACASSTTAQVYLRDTNGGLGSTQCISLNTLGDPSAGDAIYATISPDARYVVFSSDANDLVAGETGTTVDLFRYEIATGDIIRISSDESGTQGDANSYVTYAFPAVSADGDHIAFSSLASNLVSDDTNGLTDIFVYPAVSQATTTTTTSSTPRSTSRIRAFMNKNISHKATLPTCTESLPTCTRILQAFLIGQGFGVGMPVDGIVGPLTIGALTQWSIANN